MSKWEVLPGGAAMGVLFAVPVTYLAVLFVGYPGYKLLLNAGWLRAWSLCSFGGAAGAALGYALVGAKAIILTGLCGLAVALAAWGIVRKDLRDSES